MKAPKVVTLTGIDEQTNVHELLDLRLTHPWIEFGVLYSRSRSGFEPRYPSVHSIHRFKQLKGIALHLCGGARHEYLETGLLSACLPTTFHVRDFSRIQLNGPIGSHSLFAHTLEFCAHPIVPHITQFEHNPDLPIKDGANHHILFDGSGGRGIFTGNWRPPLDTFCGYAGGLGPENLERELPRIADAAGERDYWIDMESGLRDGFDRFSMLRATRICEIVQRFRRECGE